MSLYQHVLIAIDLTEESSQVIEKAQIIAAGAKISVIHVSQPLTQLYGNEIGINLTNIEADLFKRAKELLSQRVESFDVPEDEQHLAIGKPSTEIRRYAEEIKADLIVIGSHSRHGLGLLLGSTANGVLHGASCDVLAVKIDTGN